MHAGELALMKPNAAGSATTSFNSEKTFSRITSTWSASSPVLSVLLKKLDSAVIDGPWPEPRPNGVLPTSGRLNTMM